MAEAAIMGQEGDVRIKWDSDSPWEVAEAKRQFDRLKAKGYLAFKIDAAGKRSVMSAFDPDARLIVMGPMPVGG